MIRPHANEVEAVVAILESEEYDDTKAMAKALLKTTADLLVLREQYAVPHRFKASDQGINFGPFYNPSDAERFRRQIADGETCVVALYPPVLTDPSPAGVCECKHHKEMHQRGYCAVLFTNPKRICGCEGFKPPKE